MPFPYGFHFYGSDLNDDGLRRLQRMKNLVVLRMGATRVTDEGVKLLPEFPDLLEVDVSSRVTSVGLRQLKACPKLRSITIDINQAAQPGGLAAVGTLKNLETLRIDGNRDYHLPLEELRGLANLRLLVLDGHFITDTALQTLDNLNLLHAWAHTEAKGHDRPATSEEVTDLVLAQTRVTDAGLKVCHRFKNL